MDHVDITIVLDPWIPTFADKILNHEKVAEKRGKVHSSETVFAPARDIDPFFKELTITGGLIILVVRVLIKVATITVF